MKTPISLLLLSLSATGVAANTIDVDRDVFCSMHESLLVSTGLLEAAEIVRLNEQLPSYDHAKSQIVQSIAVSEKQWSKVCNGISEISNDFDSIPQLDDEESFDNKRFKPTKEQAKQLADLASQFAEEISFGLDTSVTAEKIELLQEQIRAN